MNITNNQIKFLNMTAKLNINYDELKKLSNQIMMLPYQKTMYISN